MTPPTYDPFDLVKTTVGGKYDIEEVVAVTGLSVVYRATHRVWRRRVAIKAFTAPALSDEARDQMLASFVEEGRLLMDLSERCAAICQARDVGSLTTPAGEWVPYTVLEWLDGECLEVVLRRERGQGVRPRTVAEALRLLKPIAQALAIAHERGVVHRDVKPGNIFLLKAGLMDSSTNGPNTDRDVPRAKLLDFGVAKVLRGEADVSSTIHVSRSFTPSYGAPEQFATSYGPTGPWTDVFAFALIVVELVIGHEALRGESVDSLAALSCDPSIRPTARALGATVSHAVEDVLERALAVHPHDRYSDLGALWQALTAAAEDGDPELEVAWDGSDAVYKGAAESGAEPVELIQVTVPIAVQRRRTCPVAPHTEKTP